MRREPHELNRAFHQMGEIGPRLSQRSFRHAEVLRYPCLHQREAARAVTRKVEDDQIIVLCPTMPGLFS